MKRVGEVMGPKSSTIHRHACDNRIKEMPLLKDKPQELQEQALSMPPCYIPLSASHPLTPHAQQRLRPLSPSSVPPGGEPASGTTMVLRDQEQSTQRVRCP